MILVIGESCMDVFHYGECERLCPEAPVPVFNSTRTVENGGMAMNVYNNIKQLGGDVEILTNKDWEDIKKTRFVEEKSNHMFMRVDEKDNTYGQLSLKMLNFNLYDAIIVSDYNKGYLSEENINYIGRSHDSVFLDTKKTLGNWCESVKFIKFNSAEYERSKPYINRTIEEKLIVTLGPLGARHNGTIYSVPKVDIKDTSGAGDTFVAALVSEYIDSKDIGKAIEYANKCSTVVVQKKGVATIW